MTQIDSNRSEQIGTNQSVFRAGTLRQVNFINMLLCLKITICVWGITKYTQRHINTHKNRWKPHGERVEEGSLSHDRYAGSHKEQPKYILYYIN